MWQEVRMMFRNISAAEVAAKDLYEAEIKLLEAYKHLEYAQASVAENEARVARLRGYLGKRKEG